LHFAAGGYTTFIALLEAHRVKISRVLQPLIGVLLAVGPAAGQTTPGRTQGAGDRVKSLHITLLSTMLADAGVGEWGFAALVEADGRRILFDTGYYPETVLRNARELGIDLSTVADVVLSHHHGDHTGGLLTLRRELSKVNPEALSRIHIAPGIFLRRRDKSSDREANPMVALRDSLEQAGAVFIEHDRPVELAPGVWLTGPVPRHHSERNWSPGSYILTTEGLQADSIPEDMSLVLDTDKGLVVLTGCGHAGVVNTLDYARSILGSGHAYALVGGLHLFAASDQALAWTAGQLRAAGLVVLLGAHCTGIEAVCRLRELAGLNRRTAVVGAVGASFDLERGIDPLALAQ
jgi:7,8-dihydropterin-6-yl-methyl-4-(beta-D-ribofuranosyl)aminobenzene 5'-phosphate synthase